MAGQIPWVTILCLSHPDGTVDLRRQPMLIRLQVFCMGKIGPVEV